MSAFNALPRSGRKIAGLLKLGGRASRARQKKTAGRELKPDRILQLAWGFAPTLIVATALRHRIFDLLEASPATLQQLVQRTGASERGLRAILNALVGIEFLRRDKDQYHLTPESTEYLVSNKPTYYGTYFTHMTSQLLPVWLHLDEAVQTGKAVDPVNQQHQGQTFFREFVESLFPLNYPAARTLGEHLEIHRSQGRVSVLDIGAGSGVWGIALAHLSRHVRVTAVDWPEVLNVTRRVAVREGVPDRITTVAGDLLQVSLGKDHQLAIIAHILHNEGRERGQALLRRAFLALAPRGTLAISEFLPNDERTSPPNALIFAVNMLVHTEHGDTFSFREISQWLADAGFEKPRLLEVPAPSPLILASKPA